MSKKILWNLAKLCILFLSVLAAVKMLILGWNIDEEYAITMSYRMATGDRMFLEMWEPHQSSGFVCAFFIKIYLFVLKGNLQYLVLYLRMVGILLQGGCSLFVLFTLKSRFSKDIALWASLLVFAVLPKWIQVPEFTNILLWSSICLFMCLLRYAQDGKYKHLWLMLGAIFFCCMILAYPSCIILLPIYVLGLYKISSTNKKVIWYFPLTCVGVGSLYLLYFLSHMSVSQLLLGIKQMVADSEHSYSILERVATYALEIKDLLLTSLWIILPAILITLLLCKWKKGFDKTFSAPVFWTCFLCLSILQQLLYWSTDTLFFNKPLLYFLIAYFMGFGMKQAGKDLLWLGLYPAFFILIAVLSLTNTTISVSGVFLIPGILAAFLLWFSTTHGKQRVFPWIMAASLLGMMLFTKGYMMCENEGIKADIWYVKQKALSGPAQNIYCRYLDGFTYNEMAKLLEEHVTEEDTLLVVSNHSIHYLQSKAEIGNFSTISTPTFDGRLLEYWELYPNKFPTVILVENGQEDFESIQSFLQIDQRVIETEDYSLYYTKKRRSGNETENKL